MSPGFLSDKRAIVAIILAIPLVIIAIVFVRPIDYNMSLIVFGAALALFLFACLLDTADEFHEVPEVAAPPLAAVEQHAKKKTKSKAPPKQIDDHAEVHIPEVVKPGVEPNKLPVETIEGIGLVYGKLLRKAGFPTVADMVVVDAEKVAKICDVSITQAERWIAMSRFAWLDEISEEDVEAIVFATGITDLEILAGAHAEEIHKKIKAALESGGVRVPAGYTFTLEKIKSWIASAKKYA
jgi:predicted flap endonuclease-1-like 5' DNA nuclease